MDNRFYSRIVFDKTGTEIDEILDRMQKAQDELRECYYALTDMGLVLRANPAPTETVNGNAQRTVEVPIYVGKELLMTIPCQLKP